MGKLKNYKGSIDLISGLRAKNNGDFPLMEAHDILVDESGTRLDEKLESMGEGGGTGGGSYVLEINADSGTLTNEQYNALVANAPNVIACYMGAVYLRPLMMDESVANFGNFMSVSESEETALIVTLGLVIDMNSKAYSVTQIPKEVATTSYVQNAVANASGGGSSGGMSVKSITFTDRPTAYAWLCENSAKVIKSALASNQTPIPLNFSTLEVSSTGDGNNYFTFTSFTLTTTIYGSSVNNISFDTPYARIDRSSTEVAMGTIGVIFGVAEQSYQTDGTDNITNIPDKYWSAMSAQLTCYYIE